MRRQIIRGLVNALTAITIVCCLVFIRLDAFAVGGVVTFGSTEYTEEEDSKFPIGVYISSSERNQNYHVEIKYDKNRMQYIKGADSEEDGVLVFEGRGLSSTRKYMVSFETLSGGNAYLTVVDGYTTDADGSNKQPLEELKSVDVFIEGEDTVGDIEEIEPEDIDETEVEEPANEISPVTDVVTTESSVEEKESESSDEMELKSDFLKSAEMALGLDPIMIGLIVLFVVNLAILIALGVLHFKEERANKKVNEIFAGRKNFFESLDIEDLNDLSDVSDAEEVSEEASDRDTVISVQNVTMRFKVATQNVSGIKDYLIQVLKRKMSYREFNALDDVSFDVYKGEVVGIIGTNGSGKSTILKIVSGALRPTAGEVKVDRKKVQLLTLGTGFDMELTGRENVYLNGAIIGYSREFLDAHYDEIVKFAELEDFMDEKVKNYSSGMVSRLGFAIATAGDAAEILILDEVLSVGDEFFRKKSLARVKEMIHGGSTVLLVSHSMPTIRENCSKVVWIEKGKLRMVGEPEVVCKAYQQMRETPQNVPVKASEVS